MVMVNGILAQLSMARAANKLQNIEIPVLTSPEICSKAIVDRVLERVNSRSSPLKFALFI